MVAGEKGSDGFLCEVGDVLETELCVVPKFDDFAVRGGQLADGLTECEEIFGRFIGDGNGIGMLLDRRGCVEGCAISAAYFIANPIHDDAEEPGLEASGLCVPAFGDLASDGDKHRLSDLFGEFDGVESAATEGEDASAVLCDQVSPCVILTLGCPREQVGQFLRLRRWLSVLATQVSPLYRVQNAGTPRTLPDKRYPLAMNMAAYTVRIECEEDAVLREVEEWLREGHIQAVLACGAVRADLVLPDEPGVHALEVRYVFATREDYERYVSEDAPRLREDGLRRFGPRRGVCMLRSEGMLVAFEGGIGRRGDEVR